VKIKGQTKVAEMKVLRNIIGRTRRDRISNEIIRQTCNIQNIADWITRRSHEWNEHITRMNLQRIVRQARDNHPRTRRSVGRPKKRWKDNL
jgi:predicted GTPase